MWRRRQRQQLCSRQPEVVAMAASTVAMVVAVLAMVATAHDVLTAAMAVEVKVETTEPAKMAERRRS